MFTLVVCPSVSLAGHLSEHNNYKIFMKFRRRIKHVLVTKGHNSIKKPSWSYASHYPHII